MLELYIRSTQKIALGLRLLSPISRTYMLRSLVYLFQIRSIGTTAIASNIVDSSPKPFASVKSITKPKTQKLNESILSEKEESAIALFKRYQFSDAQISTIVQKTPTILKSSVESTLEPKLKFFNENGFVGNSLTELVVKNPYILSRSLSDHLIPNTEYLKGLLNNDMAAVLSVVRRATWEISTNLKKFVQPNIDFLLSEGIEMSCILKLFTSQPRCLLYPVERISQALETVKKFGIKPSDGMFIHALRSIGSMNNSKLDKKIEILRNLGWTDEDIASTIVRQPLCLSQSEDKLTTSFEYFVKTMGLKPEYIIKHPKLLMYSLTKRSIPRCKVIMALKEKGLMEDIHIAPLIDISGEDFTRRFILKYPTLSANLWTLYYVGKPVVDDIPV